ncbi:hypothetical protein ACFL5V_10430, partial [Fibrobacterota bacterium]
NEGVISKGKVVIRLIIATSGEVRLAEVIKKEIGIANEQFESDLMSKIYKWKFRPVASGEPDVSISFPVTFISRDKRSVRR